MLARSFLSAAELRLSEAEHGALIQVLGMFERGEIVDWPGVYGGKPCSIPNAFNMRMWECGTAHCIGGWAQHVLGTNTLHARTSPIYTDALSQLFYPVTNIPMFEITVAQATRALSNYLTTGAPRWAEAIAFD